MPESAIRVLACAGAVFALCAALLIALPVAASADPNNALACGLISKSKVKSLLGVKNVDSSLSAISPTATGGNNPTTADGADESLCDFGGFDHKPTAAERKALGNINKPIPAGFGRVTVETFVRDTTTPPPDAQWTPGTAWDPTVAALQNANALAALVKLHGGGEFKTKKLGAYLERGDWITSKDRTEGFYEMGDSLIVLSVLTPNHKGPAKFNKLAKTVVPEFDGLTP